LTDSGLFETRKTPHKSTPRSTKRDNSTRSPTGSPLTVGSGTKLKVASAKPPLPKRAIKTHHNAKKQRMSVDPSKVHPDTPYFEMPPHQPDSDSDSEDDADTAAYANRYLAPSADSDDDNQLNAAYAADHDEVLPDLLDDSLDNDQRLSNENVRDSMANDLMANASASANANEHASAASAPNANTPATTTNANTPSAPTTPASFYDNTVSTNAGNQVLSSAQAQAMGYSATSETTVAESEQTLIDEARRSQSFSNIESVALRDFQPFRVFDGQLAVIAAYACLTLAKATAQWWKRFSPGPRDFDAASLPAKGVVASVGTISLMKYVFIVMTLPEMIKTIQNGVREGTTNGTNWAVASMICFLCNGDMVKVVYWGKDAFAFLASLHAACVIMAEAKITRICMVAKTNCIDVSQGINNCFNFQGPSGYPGDRAVLTLTARQNAGPTLPMPEFFLWNATSFNHRQPHGEFHSHHHITVSSSIFTSSFSLSSPPTTSYSAGRRGATPLHVGHCRHPAGHSGCWRRLRGAAALKAQHTALKRSSRCCACL